MEFSNDRRLSFSLNENISIKLLSPKKTEQYHWDINAVSSEECAKSLLENLIKATIIKDPDDVTVFRGNSAVLRVTYQGHPEPKIKWLRVVSFAFLVCIYRFHRLLLTS